MTEFYKAILGDIDSKYDKSEGGFVSDLVKAVSIQFESQKGSIVNILDSLDVEKLTDMDLERFIYQRSGIQRKLATYATTLVEFTGSIGAVVNEGSLVSADDIFYTVNETVYIDSNGKALAEVRCKNQGAIGNVPQGAINSFPITIDSISTVTNISAVANGYEKESDADLRERYYEKLQKPGKAGNEFHYLEWAKSVVGVGKVKVFRQWNGALTVKLSILDSNTEQASEDLTQRVYDYIETQKPFGAIVTVTTGNVISVDVSVELVIEPTHELDSVKAIIKQRLQNYLKTLTYEATYISYAQIGKEILNVEGVQDYSNLLVNGKAESVLLDIEDIPVINELL